MEQRSSNLGDSLLWINVLVTCFLKGLSVVLTSVFPLHLIIIILCEAHHQSSHEEKQNDNEKSNEHLKSRLS